MDIKGTTAVHLAQYAAPYLGNFVKSLMLLEKRLAKSGGGMVYVFRLRHAIVYGSRALPPSMK